MLTILSTALPLFINRGLFSILVFSTVTTATNDVNINNTAL